MIGVDLRALLGNLIPAMVVAGTGVLTHLSYRHRWAWWAYKSLLWLYVAVVGAMTLLFGLLRVAAAQQPDILERTQGPQMLTLETLEGMFLGGALVFILSLLVLIRPTRRLIFKPFPASPDSPPHELGAVCAFSISAIALIYLFFFYDIEAVLAMMAGMNLLEGVVSFLILQIVVVLAGVGLYVRRSVPEALERLGLTAVTPRTGWFMFGLGVGVFFVVFFLGEWLIRPLVPPEFLQFEKVMQPPGDFPWNLLSGFGIALGAGIGEELFFRGLLQPVFGLVPTAIFFALIHFHYGLTPLMLMVVLLGILFGWIRKRYNTTAAIIVHASYDLAALATTALLTYLAHGN